MPSTSDFQKYDSRLNWIFLCDIEYPGCAAYVGLPDLQLQSSLAAILRSQLLQMGSNRWADASKLTLIVEDSQLQPIPERLSKLETASLTLCVVNAIYNDPENFATLEDASTLLAEYHRVLNEGGKLVIMRGREGVLNNLRGLSAQMRFTRQCKSQDKKVDAAGFHRLIRYLVFPSWSRPTHFIPEFDRARFPIVLPKTQQALCNIGMSRIVFSADLLIAQK